MPMGKVIKRPSMLSKKKKKVSEGPSRDTAVDILVALVRERGLDNFESKDEIESYMSDNMPAFYQDRDTGKAIEDAMARLEIDGPLFQESDDYEMTTCDYCHGNEWDPDGPQDDDNHDDCPKCAGTGEIPKDDLGGSLTSEGINEDYDPALVSMLAKFEDDCQDYGYYGDTDMVSVDELIRLGKPQEAAEEMAGAMADQDGGSDKFDQIYDMALDAVEDYMHVEEMRRLAGMPEGKSPHKKGSAKYKKHMAAMHAGG
jgi:hypothetical protein